jgi:hypothetical protein
MEKIHTLTQLEVVFLYTVIGPVISHPLIFSFVLASAIRQFCSSLLAFICYFFSCRIKEH